LVAGVRELAVDVETVPIAFRTVPSTTMTPTDWLDLNRLIHEVIAGDDSISGIVIAHGTATLEETAYFLNLTLKVDVPVVLVGSQRPIDSIGSDARSNLLDAIRTAASPRARGMGVLVVVNGEIHTAREVTKTSTHRLDTFVAHDFGMVGYADVDGTISIYREPARARLSATEFDVRTLADLPRVDIAYSYAGSDGTAIEAFVEVGARGVVLAGLAPGKPTPGEARAAAAARNSGVVMVQSSRGGSGRVLPRRRLLEQGFVVADNLSPQKARVLTTLALTVTDDLPELGRIFSEY
jgi:L-asparaginase